MSIDSLKVATLQTATPVTLRAVPTQTAAKILAATGENAQAATGDQAKAATVSKGIPATADVRKERALGLVQQMLAPVDAKQAGSRWITPEADTATQQERGLRLAADLQDPRALSLILPLVKAGNAKAAETFNALLPFADASTLAALQTATKGNATVSTAVDQTLAARQAGTPAQTPEHSGAAVHFREAGRGMFDMAKDLTVGTAKQVAHDPLHFPTQFVAGMGTSLHNAVKNTGGAVVGLVTGGRYGSFGAQMTQELGNAAMWGSGFAKPRKTNMHPEFAKIQAEAGHKFVRDMSAWHEFIPAEGKVAQKLQKALHLPESVTKGLSKVERGTIRGAMSFIYGAEVILPGETKQVKGAIWKEKGTEASTGSMTLGCVDKTAYDMFNNKWNEYSIVNKADPTAMAETHLAKDLITELGLELPKTAAEAPAFMEALQSKLDQKFPKGYFIKGVNDYNTGGNLITNKANFVESLNGFHNEFLPYVAEMAKKFPDADLQPKINGHKFMSGRALQAMIDNPESVIIQEKLPLSKYTNKALPINKQPFNEIRVHTVRGKVIPGASAHRWSDMKTITQGKMQKSAEAFVQKVMDKLPQDIKDRTALSPDVAQLEDGSFKILEMNAGGDSGFLHPVSGGLPMPHMAHYLAEAVTGRETNLMYVVRRAKISVAVAATGATHQQHDRVQDNK